MQQEVTPCVRKICSVCGKALADGEVVTVREALDGNGFGPVLWAHETCGDENGHEEPWPGEMGQ